MKIAKTTAHTLRVPYQFPLIKQTQHALTTFVEIETDDGLKGHAFSVYPQRYSVADLINREEAPVITGLDPTRPEQVRKELGDKVTLMVDANKNAKLPQAIRVAKSVEDCNLAWFEDPVLKADPRLMAKLRRETTIPIAAGSSGTYDLAYLREYFINESIDICQPNVRDIGGFTGALHAAGLAQAYNIQLEMGGNFPPINMHLHAGVPNGRRAGV